MREPPQLDPDNVYCANDCAIRGESSLRATSLRLGSIIICVLTILMAAIFYLIASFPVRGVVRVESRHSEELQHILEENGMRLWNGIGSLGWFSVAFDNPIALSTIDDLVLDDARVRKYRCRIEYECVVSYFNYERSVN